MKIIRNTPQQLIVANKPWLIGIALILFILAFVGAGLLTAIEEPKFGIPFALFGGGIGAACFVAFVRRVQVIFDCSSNLITIRKQSLYAYSEDTHPLSQLNKAVLETTVSSMNNGNASTMYRPSLDIGGTLHPMVTSYTNTRGPARLVNAVNKWLQAAPLDSARDPA
ncbi:hypothetical protein EBB79_00835 [Parasedimentitalea marina]|uniref:Uncharacterized protein n=1 Tax=Parasedimentitalea marina TaxID=2483033 RepID=A0A3T0MXU9_9RHOB|nr:hypothetical protein [Parasedimentitalea marina]AZV76582.1 hypothetical protein EBB79_00835 [Parasedimentitalea marina]